MKRQENSNIINFKKPFQFNIGRIIFAVLFVYLIIIVISYALKSHVAAYEVQLGTLASNNTYKALAVRNETVIKADKSGYINYYAKEGTKISSKSLIYSLSYEENLFSSEGNYSDAYSNEEIQDIQQTIDDFYYSFDKESFYHSYNFYNTLNANLLNAIMTNDYAQDILNQTNTYYGTIPGVIIYNIDGLETVTVDNFTDEEINALNYSSKNLISSIHITSGSPVYKVITDENWNLIIEVDNSLIYLLEGKSSVKIRFIDDDFTCSVPFDSLIKNGKYYLILELNNHMIRYSTQRYIDIEVITDAAKGYKIPTSCIAKEDFVKIPIQYATVGGNSSQTGFLKQEKNKDGDTEAVFYAADLYKETDGYYYVLAEDFSIGDKIIIPSTGETYMINEKEALEGVYCVNKGYAVFKLIESIYQNEDYCIIKTNTSYGISNYDHIVLDGSKVKNGQMIN